MSDVKITLKEHGMEISGPAELMWPFVQRFLSIAEVKEEDKPQPKAITDDRFFSVFDYFDDDDRICFKTLLKDRLCQEKAAISLVYAEGKLNHQISVSGSRLDEALHNSGFGGTNYESLSDDGCGIPSEYCTTIRGKKCMHYKLTDAGRAVAIQTINELADQVAEEDHDADESDEEVGVWDILDEGQDAELFIKSKMAARLKSPSEAVLVLVYAYHELSDVGWLTEKRLRASLRESGFPQSHLPDLSPKLCQMSYMKTKTMKHFRLTEAGREKAGEIMQRVSNEKSA